MAAVMHSLTMSDEQREARICELGDAIVQAESPITRALYWAEMRDLILARSPEQVRRMEQEKGFG